MIESGSVEVDAIDDCIRSVVTIVGEGEDIARVDQLHRGALRV